MSRDGYMCVGGGECEGEGVIWVVCVECEKEYEVCGVCV